MQTAFHQMRQLTAHQRTEWVVAHISLDDIEHSRTFDDAVVITSLEK